ncbi:Multimeric flavodoxin WrbA [Parelusimicrobium proximum]|uniref:flavodoxin family protein n=1 Tax=Parelusimicrobium proximum TaxID=3228953 RepID=UPI003D179399
MYALAINGSPRKDGNTAVLLNTVLAPLKEAGWETEIFSLAGKTVKGCTACYKCRKDPDMSCTIKNDVLHEGGLLEKILKADAIILGSPTYYAGITPELKAVIDRAGFVSSGSGRALKGKIGAAVVAVRRGGATHVFDTINHFFLISGMIIPGSTYWNMGYGMNAGEVEADEEGLANMKNLGENINWLGKAIAPHKDSFPS